MSPDYLLAFITGLLGGFGHCIGMCGPIVAAYALPSGRTGVLKLLPHLIYNAGRVTTYALMGAAMGLAGSFVGLASGFEGAQTAVQIAAGGLMALMGLLIAVGFDPFSGISCNRLMEAGKSVLTTNSAFKYYPLGLLFGFLPCGLSYSILIGSAGTGGPVKGGALALSFGLGTLPALLLFGLLVSHLGARMRTRFYRLSGALLLFMGGIFIYRGLNGQM